MVLWLVKMQNSSRREVSELNQRPCVHTRKRERERERERDKDKNRDKERKRNR